MCEDLYKTEIRPELLNDLANSKEPQEIASGDRSASQSNDIRLQDIEEQLEMAESRCNNLKDQLDYMKHMYGANRKTQKSRKISNIPAITKNSSEDSTSCYEITNTEPRSNLPSRQKSNAIGTDNTGAAVITINNILNGITNSVNRLSEIHSQIATPRVQKVSAGVSPRPDNEPSYVEGSTAIIPEIKIESSIGVNRNQRGSKRKANKSSKTSSQHTIKKTSKIERKVKQTLSRSAAILDKRSSTFLRKRYFNKVGPKTNNLVEIYHNDAIKNSDSDESNLKKSRQQERNTSKDCEEVPPLNILVNGILNVNELQSKSAKTEQNYQNGISRQYLYDPPEAPRTSVSCCYSKNYELPTVASRMKQVAKSYLSTLNFKTIPFCAAISTTQSHNIGINIQQVMNIIKNRQPINGISPTLAHNIGLAAEKLNSKPFSALVSTINSRIAQTASRCPLSSTYLNLQHLQEQAKNIPEETIEEADEENAESPQTNTVIITGPSGDMEVKNKNVPVWRCDKNSINEQCTCIAQPNVHLQHVASRYQRNNRTLTENTLNSQIIENQLKRRLSHQYKTMKNRYSLKNSLVADSQVQNTNPPTINQENPNDNSLKGRERNLKEVLTNLHHDFEYLNKKYEDLSQKNSNEQNDDSIKELERLESELSKKEEEITMVMTLYKEVLALKQQVKQLKEKRSQASIPAKETKDAKAKYKEYNNPEAAFHLTKLLRQIQHYQLRYKTNVSEE